MADAHQSFLTAKSLVFAWLGAAFGPSMVLMGVFTGQILLALFGALFAFVAVAEFRAGLAPSGFGKRTDFILRSVVTAALAVLGCVFSILMITERV